MFYITVNTKQHSCY